MLTFRELPDWARRNPPPGVPDISVSLRNEIESADPGAEILFNCLVGKWEVFCRTLSGAWREMLIVEDDQGRYMAPDMRLPHVMGACRLDVARYGSYQKAWDARIREDKEREQKRKDMREREEDDGMRQAFGATRRAAIALDSSAHFSENPLSKQGGNGGE